MNRARNRISFIVRNSLLPSRFSPPGDLLCDLPHVNPDTLSSSRVRLLLLVAAAVSVPSPLRAAESATLVTNGNFESDSKTAGWPDGWGKPTAGVAWEQESGNRFLRLRSKTPGRMITMHRVIPIPPEARAIEFSCRMRTSDLKPGKEAWFDARIMMDFKAADGSKLKPGPPPPYLRKNTEGWVERTFRCTVPAGAKTLDLMPALFQVNAGTLDVDDFVIRPVAVEAVPVTLPRDVTPPEMSPEPANQSKWPRELHVKGNQLQTADGQAVWLQGLNVVSLEFGARGEHVLRNTQVAVDDWKANAIRLPVKEDYWFGSSGGNAGGAAYRDLVDAVITIAANRGAYVVLDLHRYRAPRHTHVDFWKDAAAKYKDHPAVLFDLLNEPHGTSWEVWRNGGFIEDKETPVDEEAFLSEADKAQGRKGWQSPGMQALVDAVRSTGAKNIIVAGGLDYAYDLSGIVNGFALDDRGGRGIMYSTHIYPWKRGWEQKVLPAAKLHPILVGEVGADTKKMAFIPPEAQEDPYTWAPDMLGFIQKHRLNWTAFSFHPKATPVVILDWSYAPTPYWGSFVRSALRGGAFELNRMR